MIAKTDRRVQRTRKLLQEAILELAVMQDFEKITVEQITEHVNLGRTTFYLHYKDKTELLLDSLHSQINSIFDEIYSPENIDKWINEGIDPRKLIFTHAAKNPNLYKLLFTEHISGKVSNQFRLHIAAQLENITKAIQEKHNVDEKVPNPVVANYVSGALIGLLIWWLENDTPYSPEEMYSMYYTLMVEGAVKSIGL